MGQVQELDLDFVGLQEIFPFVDGWMIGNWNNQLFALAGHWKGLSVWCNQSSFLVLLPLGCFVFEYFTCAFSFTVSHHVVDR